MGTYIGDYYAGQEYPVDLLRTLGAVVSQGGSPFDLIVPGRVVYTPTRRIEQPNRRIQVP